MIAKTTSISVQTDIRDSETQTLPYSPNDCEAFSGPVNSTFCRPSHEHSLLREDVEYVLHANSIEKIHDRIPQGADIPSIRERAKLVNVIALKKLQLSQLRVRYLKSRELTAELSRFETGIECMRNESADLIASRMRPVEAKLARALLAGSVFRERSFRRMRIDDSFVDSDSTRVVYKRFKLVPNSSHSVSERVIDLKQFIGAQPEERRRRALISRAARVLLPLLERT